MKIIYLFLLIILGCGDEMSKPDRFIFNMNETNTGSIESYEDDGFEYEEILSSEATNGLFIRIREWAEYMDKIVAKVYHVSGVDGDDDNDGLTEGTPFETLEKAIEIAEQYGKTVIFVNDLGYYEFSKNIEIADKDITVIGVSGSVVRFKVYQDGNNKIYGLNLKRSRLTIATESVQIEAPSAGAAWSGSDATCFYVEGGESEININCPISFSSQAAASGKAVLVTQANATTGQKGMGKTRLNIYGDIDTEDNAYILKHNNGLAEINYFGTIDHPENWFTINKQYQYELGLPYDGSTTTFVFGGTKWTSGTFGAFEETIDISGDFQDFFDLVYGSGNTVVTASEISTATILTVEIESGTLEPLHFKHENTGTSTTTYGIAAPKHTANFVKTNF